MEVRLDTTCLEIDDPHTKRRELGALVVGEHHRSGLECIADAREGRKRYRGDRCVVHDHAFCLEEEGQEGLRHGDVGPDVQIEEVFAFAMSMSEKGIL